MVKEFRAFYGSIMFISLFTQAQNSSQSGTEPIVFKPWHNLRFKLLQIKLTNSLQHHKAFQACQWVENGFSISIKPVNLLQNCKCSRTVT